MIFTYNPGSGTVKFYATLDIKTNDEALAGEPVDIIFNTDPLYIIRPTRFNEIPDDEGYYHTTNVRVQSLGDYSIICGETNKNITVESFTFIEVDLAGADPMVYGKLIPYMTSNNSPAPIVLTGSGTSANYPLWRLFDGTNTPMQASGKNTWLLIDFGEEVRVSDLKFIPSANYGTRLPTVDVKIYVGDTDTPETLVREGALPSDNYIVIDESKQLTGRYCKLEMTTTQSYTQILELNINGYKLSDKSYPLIPSMSSANAPYGTVSASYDIGSGNASLRPFQGFNNSASWGWFSGKESINQWIRYHFISNVGVKSVSMGLKKSTEGSTLTKVKIEIRNQDDNLIDTIELNINSINTIEFSNVVTTNTLKFIIVEADGTHVVLHHIQAYG